MIPLKLYAYAGGAVLLASLLWWAHRNVYQSGYRDATDAMAKQVAQANEATRLAEINSREAVEKLEYDHQKSLQDLDTRYRDAADRLGNIRVSKCPAGGVALSRSPQPAAVDHGPASPNEFPRYVHRDIERLLRQADEQAERLIACQAFAASLPSTCSAPAPADPGW